MTDLNTHAPHTSTVMILPIGILENMAADLQNSHTSNNLPTRVYPLSHVMSIYLDAIHITLVNVYIRPISACPSGSFTKIELEVLLEVSSSASSTLIIRLGIRIQN